jgi:hypothetical protein
MPTYMIRQPRFDSALFGHLFQYLIACAITWHEEQPVIPAIAFVFLDYPLGDFQQPDTGIGIGFCRRVIIHK